MVSRKISRYAISVEQSLLGQPSRVFSWLIWWLLVDKTNCLPVGDFNSTAMRSAEASEQITTWSEARLIALSVLAGPTFLLESVNFTLSLIEDIDGKSRPEGKILKLEIAMEKKRVRKHFAGREQTVEETNPD
ncbi:MAG: hypothetical protein MMC33_002861 [Icmadophila ericetorum]|nr:hypothetical protein [Icmadophila ericetorum]